MLHNIIYKTCVVVWWDREKEATTSMAHTDGEKETDWYFINLVR
jgi:hypothetical protein